MSEDLSLEETKKEWHGTLKSYAIGFFSSFILTIISFSLVALELLSSRALIYAITGLAIVQAIIQILFFLHVGQEAKPRWESLTLYFMLLILFIVVFGSLWIMFDLNHRVMFGMDHGS